MLRARNDSSIYTAIDHMQFVDVPKIVAYDKTRMYMGGGVEFKHTNPKYHEIWHNFVKSNDFYNFMFIVEQYMSEMGACFVTLNKNKAGGILVNVANPFYSNAVTCAFGNPYNAVLIEQVSVDNKINLIRSVYDREKVVRTLWTSDDAVVRGQLNIQEYVSQLPKDKQLEFGEYREDLGAYVKYHNFGFCPVFCFKNKPFFQHNVEFNAERYTISPFDTTNNINSVGWSYNSIKDTAKCSGLIEQLQNGYSQANKLMLLDKPRIVISGLNQITANKLRQDKQLLASYLKDIMINTGNNGGDVKTLAPSNTLNFYYEFITNTWKDIYRACGMSYATQTSVQKTAQESNSSYEQSIQEINFLRTFHTNQWIDLIEKVFLISGMELGDKEQWSFQVKRNMVIDESSKLNNLVTQLQNGMKTIPQAIAIVEGIDEDNAQHLWEENKKWFEDNDMQLPNQIQPNNELAMGGASLEGSEENGGRPEQEGE